MATNKNQTDKPWDERVKLTIHVHPDEPKSLDINPLEFRAMNGGQVYICRLDGSHEGVYVYPNQVAALREFLNTAALIRQ